MALYSFNSKDNEWEKTDIEGTLFVYTRSANPINGFMILNRLGLNNQIEPITKDLEFQLQDPFLLYRNASAIFGIWFYDKDECARIGQLMNSFVQLASKGSRQRRASESDSTLPNRIEQPKKSVDILQMLSKAQDEYNKASKSPNEPRPMIGNPSASATPGSSNLIKPTARRVSPSPPNVEGDGPKSSQVPNQPISIEDLFRNASISASTVQDKQGASKAVLQRSHSNCESGADVPVVEGGDSQMPHLLQRLMSANMVQEIERQQREVGMPSGPPVIFSGGSTTVTTESMNDQLKRTLNIIPSSPSRPPNTGHPLAGLTRGTTPGSSSSYENGPNVQTGNSHTRSTSLGAGKALRKSVPSQPQPPDSQALAGMGMHTVGSAPTLSCMAGQAVAGKNLITPGSLSQHTTLQNGTNVIRPGPARAQAPSPLKLNTPANTVLISPMEFEKSSTGATHVSPPLSAGPRISAGQMFAHDKPDVPQINPLTKEQMQQALLYLIKNDPSFMTVLHEAYVKSLTADIGRSKKL